MTATAATDRVAVVTGGAQGIGEAIVARLVARGHSVAILDLDLDRAQTVVARHHDGRTIAVQADISDQSQVERALDAVRSNLGDPSIVVNNVGWTPNKPYRDLTVEEEEKVVAINLMGPLRIVRATLPAMVADGFGRVVFIGSDAARVGTPKETVYAAAKAAVGGFAKALAVEVARDGVTVNVVSPGTTDTALLRAMLTDEQIEKRIKANPSGRIGTPDDIAGAVDYFCSPDAAFITGQILSVNGGMSRVG